MFTSGSRNPYSFVNKINDNVSDANETFAWDLVGCVVALYRAAKHGAAAVPL